MYFFRYLLAICLLWCGHALAKPKETIVGQPAHINVDDPYVQMASQYAVSSISEGSGSKQKLGLLKVVSATRQVVSGSLYTIKLQVARTDCKNDVCAISLSAASRDDPDFNECTVKIWDQPWVTPRYKITELKCSKRNANEVSQQRRKDRK
ncbi:hypothetical protein M8J75_010698 [Diaphorina citri]|nr:hypothetical protein M8J75_010698 [Diaphorina citri]